MRMFRRVAVAVAVAGGALASADPLLAATGPAHLLADLNQVPSYERGSFPQNITSVGDYSLFRATTNATGYELWRTDGTEAGTRMVKDIWPGPNSGTQYYSFGYSAPPFEPTVFGDAAYFLGNDGTHGWELWRTDGTEAGTSMVKDIRPGSGNAFEQGFDYHDDATLVWKHFVVGGALLFIADDGVNGLEWWRTDGTEAGTAMLKDIMPGRNGAFGQLFSHQLYYFNAAMVGDVLYFSADDGIAGFELWETDGTTDGTTRVRDINPGAAGSQPMQMLDLNGVLIFVAYEPRGGAEVWRSDGTFAGTAQVRDIFPGSFGASPNRLVRVGDLVYFGSYQYLYRTDGTFSGTVLLHTFDQGSTYVVGSFGYQAVVQAYDNAHGTEFWLSDGTPGGTRLLKDINPGPGSANPGSPVELNGRLFFTVGDSSQGWRLWTSDGTDAGTREVGGQGDASSSVYVSAPTKVGSHCVFFWQDYPHRKLMATDDAGDTAVSLGDLVPDGFGDGASGSALFSANDGVHGFELWKTDGTPAGTTLVKDIVPILRTDSSYPAYLATLASPGAPTRVLFTASDGVHGYELWSSDGTTAGTHLMKDFIPGPDGAGIGAWAVYRGAFYFMATTDYYSFTLWRTDGTEAGTVQVMNSPGGPTPESRSPLVVLNDRLYYLASDATHGIELWRSDGTSEGSEFVADLNPGPGDSSIDAFLVVGDTLFLNVYSETYGSELFKSDGTAAGTGIVKDIVPGPDSSFPYEFARFGDRLIFTAQDDEHGRELWVSDGTEAGTIMLKDIYPGFYSGAAYGDTRAEAGGWFYFVGTDGVHGAELWKTDGTPDGTVLVKDVVPGRNPGYIESLTAFKGAVYFGVRGFPYDDQLWKTDGTEAGTVPVKVGFILGAPGLNVIDDALIFAGNDFDAHGRELWRSDGTAAGTAMLQDLNPGPDGSDPENFFVAGDRTYFNADNGTSNVEPWVARAAILAGNPRQGLQDLIDEVKTLGLPKGEETSLVAKLNEAARAIDDGRPVNAAVALEVFAIDVEVLTPRRLSESVAADLKEFAAQIGALLDAPPRPRGPRPKGAALRTTGRPSGVTVSLVVTPQP